MLQGRTSGVLFSYFVVYPLKLQAIFSWNVMTKNKTTKTDEHQLNKEIIVYYAKALCSEVEIKQITAIALCAVCRCGLFKHLMMCFTVFSTVNNLESSSLFF